MAIKFHSRNYIKTGSGSDTVCPLGGREVFKFLSSSLSLSAFFLCGEQWCTYVSWLNWSSLCPQPWTTPAHSSSRNQTNTEPTRRDRVILGVKDRSHSWCTKCMFTWTQRSRFIWASVAWRRDDLHLVRFALTLSCPLIGQETWHRKSLSLSRCSWCQQPPNFLCLLFLLWKNKKIKLAPSSGCIWLHSRSHPSGQEAGALILKSSWGLWGADC